MRPPLSVTLSDADHAALLQAVRNAGAPAAVPVTVEHAVKNGGGTRTLRINASIAWMLVTGLRGAGPALKAIEAAYWAAGGPDTGFADRSLIEAAHDRGADLVARLYGEAA